MDRLHVLHTCVVGDPAFELPTLCIVKPGRAIKITASNADHVCWSYGKLTTLACDCDTTHRTVPVAVSGTDVAITVVSCDNANQVKKVDSVEYILGSFAIFLKCSCFAFMCVHAI
jgi:hypothetical protein